MLPTHEAKNDRQHLIPARPIADMPNGKAPTKGDQRTDPEARSAGKGHFFAVNRNAFDHACRRGLNEAISYLILARGSLADNRTTSWSTHAIETRTRISRKKARECLQALERVGILQQVGTSKSKPRRTLFPEPLLEFHRPGLPRLTERQREMLCRLPLHAAQASRTEDKRALGRLRNNGWIEQGDDDTWRIVAGVTVTKPEVPWIWMPNSLIDGIGDGNSPIELLRQSQSVAAVRLIVHLYQHHELSFEGGVSPALLSRRFSRQKLGDNGGFNVFSFGEANIHLNPRAPFVEPFERDPFEPKPLEGCLQAIKLLEGLGLLTFVEHVFDGPDGEILFPLARPLAGRDVTEAEAELFSSAMDAARRISPLAASTLPNLVAPLVAPIQRHIEKATLIGVARLRHRPRTSVTSEWLSKSDSWRDMAAFFAKVGQTGLQPVAARAA